jgi:hypothetical protein
VWITTPCDLCGAIVCVPLAGLADLLRKITDRAFLTFPLYRFPGLGHHHTRSAQAANVNTPMGHAVDDVRQPVLERVRRAGERLRYSPLYELGERRLRLDDARPHEQHRFHVLEKIPTVGGLLSIKTTFAGHDGGERCNQNSRTEPAEPRRTDDPGIELESWEP